MSSSHSRERNRRRKDEEREKYINQKFITLNGKICFCNENRNGTEMAPKWQARFSKHLYYTLESFRIIEIWSYMASMD